MFFQVGDKVFIKPLQVQGTTERKTTITLSGKPVATTYHVSHIGKDGIRFILNFAEKDLELFNEIPTSSEPTNTKVCECGKEKFNFLRHSQWCNAYE